MLNVKPYLYPLHTVDVRLVALKSLNVLSRAHVPHIGLHITALIKNTHTEKILLLSGKAPVSSSLLNEN